MSQQQISLYVTPKLRDRLDREAKIRKRSRNQLLVEAVTAYLDGKVDGQDFDPSEVDPLLLRMFSDDRHFNILEWVTDEGGRGEQSFNVGAKIRGGTLRIIDEILQHPNCPYSTKSDFIRDAILTLIYIAARGRLHDDRVAEFARKERQLAKIIMEQQRFSAKQSLLLEIEASVERANTAAGNFKPAVASHAYAQVGRIVREELPDELMSWAIGVAKHLRPILNEVDRERLDREFPELKAKLP